MPGRMEKVGKGHKLALLLSVLPSPLFCLSFWAFLFASLGHASIHLCLGRTSKLQTGQTGNPVSRRPRARGMAIRILQGGRSASAWACARAAARRKISYVKLTLWPKNIYSGDLGFRQGSHGERVYWGFCCARWPFTGSHWASLGLQLGISLPGSH